MGSGQKVKATRLPDPVERGLPRRGRVGETSYHRAGGMSTGHGRCRSNRGDLGTACMHPASTSGILSALRGIQSPEVQVDR